MPRLSELCERLAREFDCKSERLEISRSDGFTPKLLVIERETDGKTLRAVLDATDRPMAPSKVRSILARLDVPLKAFGLEYFDADPDLH